MVARYDEERWPEFSRGHVWRHAGWPPERRYPDQLEHFIVQCELRLAISCPRPAPASLPPHRSVGFPTAYNNSGPVQRPTGQHLARRGPSLPPHTNTAIRMLTKHFQKLYLCRNVTSSWALGTGNKTNKPSGLIKAGQGLVQRGWWECSYSWAGHSDRGQCLRVLGPWEPGTSPALGSGEVVFHQHTANYLIPTYINFICDIIIESFCFIFPLVNS